MAGRSVRVLGTCRIAVRNSPERQAQNIRLEAEVLTRHLKAKVPPLDYNVRRSSKQGNTINSDHNVLQ